MHTELSASFTSVFHKPVNKFSFGHELQCINLSYKYKMKTSEDSSLTRYKAVKFCSPHLSTESVEDVLLCDHLRPVPVHLLAKMSVFTTLQLDKSGHLSLKSLVAQVVHPLSEAYQELLDLHLHQLSAGMREDLRLRRLKNKYMIMKIRLHPFQ